MLGGSREFGLTNTILVTPTLDQNLAYLEDIPYPAATLHYSYFLNFWSLLLRFEIYPLTKDRTATRTSEPFDPDPHYMGIHCKKERLCGRFWDGCASQSMLTGLGTGDKVLCDFIVLSVGHCGKDGLRPYCDEDEATMDCLNVIAVEWADGVAERIGIGIVFSHSLERDSFEPGPQWKEIVLG